jgi:hypothetical protein
MSGLNILTHTIPTFTIVIRTEREPEAGQKDFAGLSMAG